VLKDKISEYGILFVTTHVNDKLVIGTLDGMNHVMDELQCNKFELKIVDDWNNPLRCKVQVDYDEKTMFVMQSHLNE
jgi:hypothetical protein